MANLRDMEDLKAFSAVRAKDVSRKILKRYANSCKFLFFSLEISMFRNFTASNLGVLTTAKSSVARTIREELLHLYPDFSDFDSILPKKANLQITKGRGELNHVQFLSVDGLILFFKDRDGPWLPTLTAAKKYPALMPIVQVDKGATDFVLRGANVMAPGLVSAGGSLPAGLAKDRPVQIFIEGQSDSAAAVGVLLMSSDEIILTRKGTAITNVHYRDDGLSKLSQAVV